MIRRYFYMRMRYVNPVLEISRHLEEHVLDAVNHLRELQEQGGNEELIRIKRQALVRYGFSPNVTKQEIRRDIEILDYIYYCKTEVAQGHSRKKPTVEEFLRVFTRHQKYLMRIHDVSASTKVQSTDRRYLMMKQAQACRHYIFSLKLPAYYDSLPKVIHTIEDKYPNSDFVILRRRGGSRELDVR